MMSWQTKIRKYGLIYKLNSIIIFNAYCTSIWYSFGNIIGWIYNAIWNQPLYSIIHPLSPLLPPVRIRAAVYWGPSRTQALCKLTKLSSQQARRMAVNIPSSGQTKWGFSVLPQGYKADPGFKSMFADTCPHLSSIPCCLDKKI